MEQLGIFFQIIEKSGPIPWEHLTLPEGRTKKAVQVMIDREKQKAKKAREAAATGDDGGDASSKVSCISFPISVMILADLSPSKSALPTTMVRRPRSRPRPRLRARRRRRRK